MPTPLFVRAAQLRYGAADDPALLVGRLRYAASSLGALDGGTEPSTTLWMTDQSLIRFADKGAHGLRLVSRVPLWLAPEIPHCSGYFAPPGETAESL